MSEMRARLKTVEPQLRGLWLAFRCCCCPLFLWRRRLLRYDVTTAPLALRPKQSRLASLTAKAETSTKPRLLMGSSPQSVGFRARILVGNIIAQQHQPVFQVLRVPSLGSSSELISRIRF